LGTGGGGMEFGVSRVLRVVWRWLMVLRASWRDVLADVEGCRERVFEAGSICKGRWV
jgi:hypothetical protein